MTLWEKCEGLSYIHPLEVAPWRVVETTQEKFYTRKLINSDEELEILELLIESSKSKKIDKNVYDHYHYLLLNPFCYDHGSRFGSTFGPSLWYGALKIETALREIAYYKLLFLHDTKANLKLNIPLSAYSVKAFSEKAVDLTKSPFGEFREKISSPVTYEYSQPLGADMRKNAVDLFLYYSARTPVLEKNVGVFYPHVFTKKRLLQEPLSWNCYADKTVVEFRHISKLGTKENIICYSEDFQQEGKLIYPKTFKPKTVE